MRTKLGEQWRWHRGYAPPPSGADLLLTDACDLRCDYCPRWGTHGVWHQRPRTSFMETGAVLGLVDQLAEHRPWLRLIGGEPFLHPEWSRVVRRAAGHGLWCASVSNGQTLIKHAEELVDSGLRVLGISLDGPRKVHDDRRGNGTFDIIMDGIRQVEAVKDRRGSELPLLEVLLTVHAENQGELISFAEQLVRTTGIWKLRLQQLIWTSRARFDRSLELIRSVLPGCDFFGAERGYIRDASSGVDGVLLAEQLLTLKQRSSPFLLGV